MIGPPPPPLPEGDVVKVIQDGRTKWSVYIKAGRDIMSYTLRHCSLDDAYLDAYRRVRLMRDQQA